MSQTGIIDADGMPTPAPAIARVTRWLSAIEAFVEPVIWPSACDVWLTREDRSEHAEEQPR